MPRMNINCRMSANSDADGFMEVLDFPHYMFDDHSLHKKRKFVSENGVMHIEQHETKTTYIPQLGISARLLYTNAELVINNVGCHMLIDDNFVAKVRIGQPDRLDKAQNYQEAEEVLLNQIRISKILYDEVTADRDKQRDLFLNQLVDALKQTLDGSQINMRIEMLKFCDRIKQLARLTYVELCDISNQLQCEALQDRAKELIKMEQKASLRESFFKRIKYHPVHNSLNISAQLNELVNQIVEHHRKTLTTKLPIYLWEPLNMFSWKHLILIRSSDIKLFTDISNVLRPDIFEKPIEDLAVRWGNRVNSIVVDSVNKNLQLTSPVVFFLCKSLEEVIVDITKYTDHRATDLLMSSDLGWHPIKKLVWKSENTFTKLLEKEYEFIFRLLKHFQEDFDFGRQSFQYKTQLLNKNHSTVKQILRKIRGIMDSKLTRNPFGVQDDIYIWYCLLDEVLFHILPNKYKHTLFNEVFKRYIQMICDAKYDEMETLRVVTRNLASFIAQSCSDGGRKPLNEQDMNVLQEQLKIISSRNKGNVGSSRSFRDQLDVFNSFWKIKRDIIDTFLTKINLKEMRSLQERLMEVTLLSLKKKVEVETRVAFIRTYNDFLFDLSEVSFDWYVKDIPNLDMQSVELVDNKLKDSDKRSYRVVNTEIVLRCCKGNPPKHYILEVLHTLLDHIEFLLQRTNWATNVILSDTDQVLSTNDLILAIKTSLQYLKEQVDYVSFNNFYEERVKPFDSVVKTSTSRQSFSNRINIIKESFWYIRKQNEISFEEALNLFSGLNSLQGTQVLRESYAIYSTIFQDFMQLSVNEESLERASLIAQKVKDKITDAVVFKTWNDRFKQHQIPHILAGLGAVWSILVSKDVANAGKYFNPHCIQILCVLRLLSVDNAERGINHHLAQILTGQGKSLVLGLLAALFALTGHRVRIVCYSEYLAKRDEQDFVTFYKMFGVAGKVTYGTFNDLANEIISPRVAGKKIALRDLVTDLFFKEKTKFTHRLIAADSSNNILLIDEVDVFFTKEFYGNKYNPCSTPTIPGLDRIQEQIWRLVSGGSPDVESDIQQFIKCGEFEKWQEFHNFCKRPNYYEILTTDTQLKRYKNKTFVDEHVASMVRYAKSVHSQPETWEKYRLNSEGVITYNEGGTYGHNTFNNYKNMFNYFRLKKENFVPQVGWYKNYGYLVIDCGSLSYAMLPMNYPLIVGVTGTLYSLDEYENNLIKQLYNINQTSLMPTFFGCTNLKFNKVANFHHHSAKSSWRTNIFNQANQIVAANRAVIIFFETDVELNAFKAEYAGQLDRLNVLTENTEDKERLITEAGVAKTITLATRGMGRGIDYKTTVTVEKNGGVHVIQTFFSMDVKEETQIKGRTARKDNKGSYELIVCDENSQSGHVSYDALDEKRRKSSVKENAELATKVHKAQDAHKATMAYMESFFKNG